MQERGLALEVRVADVWPEFAQAGKERVTLGEALSHQAGIPALDAKPFILEHEAVAEALAAQPPLWPPGQGQGYSPRAHGSLLEELVRRIAGQTLGSYWREIFAEPLDLDFWIGLPAEFHDTAAPVFPPKGGLPKEDPFYEAYQKLGTLTQRVFASPAGFTSVAQMNSPEARSASLPATGGIGTARALAKFYAMLASGGSLGGRRYFSERTLEWMWTPLTQKADAVLFKEVAFSAGFMMDPMRDGKKLRQLFGPSPRAFGHPGAGGSHAFADPERRLGFAYVMNQMEPGVLPLGKGQRLVKALME
jgi:CubicO group peptidase (beta-lactamase class C family)